MGRATRRREAARAIASTSVYQRFVRIAGGALELLAAVNEVADLALAAAAGDRPALTAEEIATARAMLHDLASSRMAPLRAELDTMKRATDHLGERIADYSATL